MFEMELLSGQSSLLRAARSGDVEAIAGLCADGVDVNAKEADENGDTPLYSAAKHGHMEATRLLCDHGAEVNRMCSSGLTAMHVAAHFGHVNIVEFLCGRGADVNKVDRSENTVLHVAARSGGGRILTVLCSNGADIDARTTFGMTALMMALHNRHLEVAKELCLMGADVNKANMFGETAMHFAFHRDVVSKLYECGADINGKSENSQSTPLCYACEKGEVEIIEALCDYGADPSITYHGDHPLTRLLSFACFHVSVASDRSAIESVCHQVCEGAMVLMAAGCRARPEDLSLMDSEPLKPFLERPRLRAIQLLSLSLCEICKLAIRRHIRKPIERHVTVLPLPDSVQKSLLLHERKK